MAEFVSSLLRFMLKVMLGLMAAVFAVSLLLVGLLVLAFTLIKALMTGKKPAPAMVFSRFSQYDLHNLWGRTAAPSQKSAEVVDVEVWEVTDHAKSSPLSADIQTAATTLRPARADITDVQPKPSMRAADELPH